MHTLCLVFYSIAPVLFWFCFFVPSTFDTVFFSGLCSYGPGRNSRVGSDRVGSGGPDATRDIPKTSCPDPTRETFEDILTRDP